MSSKAKTNVHVAASNLSLADLEALTAANPDSMEPSIFHATARSHSQQAKFGDSQRRSKVDSVEKEPAEDFVVVSIPTVTSDANSANVLGKPAKATFRHEDAIPTADSRLQRLPQSIHRVPFVEQLKKLADTPNARETSEYCTPEEGELVGLNLKIHGAPEADISERPDDWLPDRDRGEKRSSKKAKSLDTPKQAFSDLTAQVLEQFPLGPSSVLMIADADGNSSGDSVAYQLAVQLCGKNVGRVLLVDSHFEERRLSERLSLGFENGLADILSTNKSLQETLCETENSNLDFLPVGTDRMCRRRSPDSTWLADNIRTLKDHYQFVIVSAGNVFHRSTELWGQHCDATYMAIELGSTNQTIAKSGVVRLQQYGARLMGCVVTDVAA